MNMSEEHIRVLRGARLQLPDGRTLELPLDPAGGVQSTRGFPAVLHPGDRVALTLAGSALHAQLTLHAVQAPVTLVACFVDMTGVEYLSAADTLPAGS
ncbi:hypothetical protein [Deinococcus multiflagellatus]|nr:hypothetical protein [Deinococcus multiflagellatus]MBZ9714979.1 hypothetical protein [Deinococcus multiflagellatus]